MSRELSCAQKFQSTFSFLGFFGDFRKIRFIFDPDFGSLSLHPELPRLPRTFYSPRLRGRKPDKTEKQSTSKRFASRSSCPATAPTPFSTSLAFFQSHFRIIVKKFEFLGIFFLRPSEWLPFETMSPSRPTISSSPCGDPNPRPSSEDTNFVVYASRRSYDGSQQEDFETRLGSV